MIDFHNHLIPGIDDGSPDVETSLRLFQGLSDLGFTQIICTPHIIADTHPNTPETIANAAEKLKTESAQLGIDLQFQYGAEYMLDDNFHQALANRENLLTVHGKKILVEFSYIQKLNRIERFSFELQVAGYEPILAHPERYIYYHNNLKYYEYLQEIGFDLQLNLLSLTPYYGKEVQRVATHLLNNGLYDFACTDLHHDRHLAALQTHYTAESLRELFETHKLRNHELGSASAPA